MYWYVLVCTWPSAQRMCLSSEPSLFTISTTCAIHEWWSLGLLFAPRIGLSKRCALFQAWHRAQHPLSTSFARHCGVQIANWYINGLNRYLVLKETAVNVHNNGQWNGPLPNPENQILVQISTDKYNTVRLRTYWYVLIQDRWKIIYRFILVGTSTY